MRKPSVLPVRVLLLPILMMLLGCLASSPANQEVEKYRPPESGKVQEIDREIAKLEKDIRDLKKYETEQRQIGVINEVEHNRSRGWIKGDGKPEYEELAAQSYAQAAEAEKEIERLKRKVVKLEREKEKLQSQSTGCFPPDARVVLENGALKPLAEIVPGDRVQTYDIGYERRAGRPVVERYQVEGNHLYTINGALATTGGERLLTPDGWKKVRDLKVGDAVHADGRMTPVKSIDYQWVDGILYNLQVADTHNFYVVTPEGARYLVHNSGGGGGGGK